LVRKGHLEDLGMDGSLSVSGLIWPRIETCDEVL
jgi:hypothetical protein